MTSGFSGMNVEEVENLGRLLQQQADHINQVVGQLDSAVHNANWQGQDANTFKGSWWPQHKSQLQQVSEGLHGFGQSALNNATEQRNVSSH